MFSVQNMRNEKMKDLRVEWKPSRFFFGKNKVIALGLGRTKEEELDDDLHKLANCLKGQCGMLFTDKPKDYVTKWFNNFGVEDYARSGFEAKETISLPAGPMPDFSHAMEPYLRQLGLPTSLERGVVTLLKEYEVCKKGSTLTPEQAKVLKLLDNKLATFRLNLKGGWVKGEGFERLNNANENAEDADNEEEQMEEEDD